MKAYEVALGHSEEPTYVGSLVSAKAAITGAVEAVYRPSVVVTEVTLKLDKDSVLAMLNGKPVLERGQKWRCNNRGALRKEE